MNIYNTIFHLCSGICHQIPERSFFIFGYQTPLCARCTGIFLGSVLFLSLFWRIRKQKPLLLLVLLLPMLWDATAGLYVAWPAHNLWRFLAGLLYGSALPMLVLSIIRLGGRRLQRPANSSQEQELKSKPHANGARKALE